MRFISTIDIDNWANTIDNVSIKNIHFPYGEDVQTGGFDGELTTESEKYVCSIRRKCMGGWNNKQ